MFIRHIFQYLCYVVGTSFDFKTLFSIQSINLVVEEISQNESSVETPITDFIYEKENHVSIQHNSKLTLMISGTPFFGIYITYMIYLDVKYFSIVCLNIHYEKPAVKTTLKTMGHF